MEKAKNKTKSEIKKDIIEFLNTTSGQIDQHPSKKSCGIRHRNCLVLATCANNKPRATVLEFFNEEMTIYIFGEPGGKIGNIRRNHLVSAVVYEQPLDHSKLQRSLQLFGKAELITVRNNPRLFWQKVRKWRMDAVAKKIMTPVLSGKGLSGKEAEQFLQKGIESLSVIKITPEHAILKEWYPDFSLRRYEWKKG